MCCDWLVELRTARTFRASLAPHSAAWAAAMAASSAGSALSGGAAYHGAAPGAATATTAAASAAARSRAAPARRFGGSAASSTASRSAAAAARASPRASAARPTASAAAAFAGGAVAARTASFARAAAPSWSPCVIDHEPYQIVQKDAGRDELAGEARGVGERRDPGVGVGPARGRRAPLGAVEDARRHGLVRTRHRGDLAVAGREHGGPRRGAQVQRRREVP